ncbi:MAG TPA: hypothetical protein DDX92_06090 [Flavobacteriales bacterium]|jgi:hypothetical protein|nr:hypothetical protein [Flavobacteriales bacterium]
MKLLKLGSVALVFILLALLTLACETSTTTVPEPANPYTLNYTALSSGDLISFFQLAYLNELGDTVKVIIPDNQFWSNTYTINQPNPVFISGKTNFGIEGGSVRIAATISDKNGGILFTEQRSISSSSLGAFNDTINTVFEQ